MGSMATLPRIRHATPSWKGMLSLIHNYATAAHDHRIARYAEAAGDGTSARAEDFLWRVRAPGDRIVAVRTPARQASQEGSVSRFLGRLFRRHAGGWRLEPR